MAAKPEKLGESLFNNALLSDVTIKQHYKGDVREYHGHKAILARGSRFFMKEFTGNFKEASDNVVEVFDDHPLDFEMALKFIYTEEYDTNGSCFHECSGRTDYGCVLTAIALYTVADKYDIGGLLKYIQDDLAVTLRNSASPTSESAFLSQRDGSDARICHRAAIIGFYEFISEPDTSLGVALARATIDNCPFFVRSPDIKPLLREFPFFAVDLAIELSDRDRFG